LEKIEQTKNSKSCEKSNIPTLIVNGKKYKTNEEKTELFAESLSKTFRDTNE
jgi:hypothetical protein